MNSIMKRIIMMITFAAAVTAFAFSQQRFPAKIIGQVPDAGGSGFYSIQVGAYKTAACENDAVSRLKKAGLTPSRERYRSLTRVMVKGVPAVEVWGRLAQLKKAGFNEVIIRFEKAPAPAEPVSAAEAVSAASEDKSRPAAAAKPEPEKPAPAAAKPEPEKPAPAAVTSLSEKWNVTTPDSAYLSFEFNRDNNFIVVERPLTSADPDADENVLFGSYTMPDRNTVELDKLGTLKINSVEDDKVNFSLAKNGPDGAAARYEASKALPIATTPETGLISRSWLIRSTSDGSADGKIMLFSQAGTYLVTEVDGERWIGVWRWREGGTNEIEYSHDNWEHFGRAKIVKLDADSLEIYDPGFDAAKEGYSANDLDASLKLVPLNSVKSPD